MIESLNQIFASWSYFLLASLIGSALIFFTIGLRSIRHGALEGLLFMAIGVFFMSVHIYHLLDISNQQPIGIATHSLNLWSWLSLIYAPALIALFLFSSLLSFVTSRYYSGMIKAYFGLTLLCLLFMLGSNWAMDIRGIIASIYSGIWLNLELRTT